jgi:hypothetical protein
MSKFFEAYARRKRAELLARDGGRWIIRHRDELLRRFGREKFIKMFGCTPEEYGRPRNPGLYIVAKPEREQFELDFDGENQREIERAMAEILESKQNRRKPKVG